MPKILDREKKAKELRDYGLTYKQVGESLGVGPQRARQIVNDCERKERDKEKWYSFLPTRIYNALINSGLVVKSKNDLIDAVESGDISYKNRKIKNYGKGSHLELCKLLGLSEPVAGKLLYAIAESEDDEVVLTIFNGNELVLNQAFLGQLIDELRKRRKPCAAAFDYTINGVNHGAQGENIINPNPALMYVTDAFLPELKKEETIDENNSLQ